MKVKCAIDKNASKTASTDGLTEAEKKVILDRHNTLRCGLSAKNMNILKWNCDLETMAKCFAKRCDIKHAPEIYGKYVDYGNFQSIGENLAFKCK